MKGYPDDRDTRPGNQFAGLPLLEPPSGPQTPVPSREAGRYRAYQEWKRSEAGGRAFGWILTRAREQLLDGQQRIGVKGLAESCRAALRVEINNTHVAWISDDLVAADARLLPLIERRVRRKAQA